MKDDRPSPVTLDYRSAQQDGQAGESPLRSFHLSRRAAGDDRGVSIIKWIILVGFAILVLLTILGM